jgi:hypothetical protein
MMPQLTHIILSLTGGGGLLAGALIEHEIDDSREDAYREGMSIALRHCVHNISIVFLAGYRDGGDGGDGGDYGGDGGGDFGGDGGGDW